MLLGLRGLGPKWMYSPRVRLAANMMAAVDRQVASWGQDPLSQLFLSELLLQSPLILAWSSSCLGLETPSRAASSVSSRVSGSHRGVSQPVCPLRAPADLSGATGLGQGPADAREAGALQFPATQPHPEAGLHTQPSPDPCGGVGQEGCLQGAYLRRRAAPCGLRGPW